MGAEPRTSYVEDGPESVERLAQFDPPPNLVTRSGTGSNVHAY